MRSNGTLVLLCVALHGVALGRAKATTPQDESKPCERDLVRLIAGRAEPAHHRCLALDDGAIFVAAVLPAKGGVLRIGTVRGGKPLFSERIPLPKGLLSDEENDLALASLRLWNAQSVRVGVWRCSGEDIRSCDEHTLLFRRVSHGDAFVLLWQGQGASANHRFGACSFGANLVFRVQGKQLVILDRPYFHPPDSAAIDDEVYRNACDEARAEKPKPRKRTVVLKEKLW